MRIASALCTLAACGTMLSLGASELADPPELAGWRYSHRLYHGLAGAAIGIADAYVLEHVAPEWVHRHPVLARLVAEAPVVGAGVGKELVDHAHGPESLHHSIGDAIVTATGGTIGIELVLRW